MHCQFAQVVNSHCALSSTPPLRVAISFGGLANGMTPGRMVMFNITNQDPDNISLVGTCIVRQQSTEQVLSFRSDVFLTNGQSHVVTITAPTNGAPWKVVFICTHNEWRRRLTDKIGPSPLLDWLPDSIRGAPGHRFETAWIDK